MTDLNSQISILNYTGEKFTVAVSNTAYSIPPTIIGSVDPSDTVATMFTVNGIYDTYQFAGKTYFGRVYSLGETTTGIFGRASSDNTSTTAVFTIIVGIAPNIFVDSSGKPLTPNTSGINYVMYAYLNKYSKSTINKFNDFIDAKVKAATGDPISTSGSRTNYFLILLVIIAVAIASVAAYAVYMKRKRG
jgi:hypothetical protein